jgi:hypothetical protein
MQALDYVRLLVYGGSFVAFGDDSFCKGHVLGIL